MRLTRKKSSSKNKNNKDAAKPRGNRLQYRCTIQGIRIFYQEVKDKLRKEHHDAFEKTPFKHLFKALHDDAIIKEKKKDKLLDNLILCYDRKTKKFKFGSEFYKPTRLDVKLIFGIEDGTEDVGETAAYGRASKLESRYFAKGRITVKKAKDKVKELIDNEDQESIDDAVKLLCVLILHNVFFPNTGASITRGFLYYVDDFDRLNSYDWSQHVLDELMSGLQADWSKPKQVNGCILLLPYWFCEHSYKIPDKYKNGEENEPVETGGQGISSKGIPRVTKWKLKNLEQLVEKSALHKLDRNMFNNNELIPTIAEQHLIKSLCVKQKAKNIVMEHDLGLEQPPADVETSMGLMKRKSERLKRVTKKKAEEGSDVESGYSSEGNEESEAAHAEKDNENYKESEDNPEGMSNAEAESAHDELMKSGFDMSEIHMSENVEEPRNSSKRKSIAEARNVRVQDKPKKKKELRKTVSVLGKRKKRLTKENIKEKNGLKKDVKMRKLEKENSRLKGIVDSLKREKMNLIGKQETMAAEHFEMEIALDDEVSKKIELLSELENEKLARKELLNELALAKIKIEQQGDKAKENVTMDQDLQACIQNLPHNSVGQNFGQVSIQQQEVTMIESLGERVAAEHFEMEKAGDEETMAAEHSEIEMALDEEITKKTELLCEPEKGSEAKENESVVQKLQNLVPGSGSQNFGQESIQQQEVGETMIESLGERVAAEHFEKEMVLGEESMAAEHFEMEVVLDEDITTKTDLCELENESEAKENEVLVQNLQTYIPNLVLGSGSQNFGQESIQQQEVDKTMIESLGERVAAEHFEMGEETMAAEHFEMEVALDEEITKKTEFCELENESEAKENESEVQNLQDYIPNLVPGSGRQIFGQESIQQQEVDKTMIESLGERVAAEQLEMETALGEETMAAEHFEMEVAFDEEITKKTEFCELENENEAKGNESEVQNLQAYIFPGSGSQNFGQESIQQQEVDKTMIESLGERVAAEHFEMETVLGEEPMAAEHFEKEVALDEEITKKTEFCELENESEVKENEIVVQNLQTYIPNLVPGSGSQNFGQESIQQQEVDKTMIEPLGERGAAENFEMEMVSNESITKKTELCELENEKLARKNLLNDEHEDKAKKNECKVQNLQTCLQNLVPCSGSQNFCQESIQQEEVDKTMIELLGEGVARLDEVVHEKDTSVSNLEAMNQD